MNIKLTFAPLFFCFFCTTRALSITGSESVDNLNSIKTVHFIGRINGRNFYYDELIATQEGSKIRCEELGMSLARLAERSELDQILYLISIMSPPPFYAGFWTGGRVKNLNQDLYDQRAFEWDNGVEVPTGIEYVQTVDKVGLIIGRDYPGQLYGTPNFALFQPMCVVE